MRDADKAGNSDLFARLLCGTVLCRHHEDHAVKPEPPRDQGPNDLAVTGRVEVGVVASRRLVRHAIRHAIGWIEEATTRRRAEAVPLARDDGAGKRRRAVSSVPE